MPVDWGSLAGGVFSGLGSLGGTALSYSFMKKEAERNRAFQKKMASTQHQRAIRDLRKAGLNPILSAKYGGNAAPAGSVASVPDFGDAFGKSISTAVSGARAKTELSNLEKTGDLIDAQAKKANAEALAAGRYAIQGTVQNRIGSWLLEQWDKPGFWEQMDKSLKSGPSEGSKNRYTPWNSSGDFKVVPDKRVKPEGGW